MARWFAFALSSLVAIGVALSYSRVAGAAESIPPTAQRLVDQGDKLEEKGDHKGAIAAYDEAIADDPGFAYAFASRCESEWALDQNEAAARDCERRDYPGSVERLCLPAVRARARRPG